jgi:hypothetical protein
MTRWKNSLLALAGVGVLLSAAPAKAAIDWAGIPGKEVMLFYPGQSSYEWSLTTADMSGAEGFRLRGKNCDSCHIGEEKDMGARIVTGKPRVSKLDERPSIEPAPIAGKPGAFPATLKIASDASDLFVHVEFDEGAQPDAAQDPAFATKVTVMLISAKVPEATRAGCWAACHDDAATMPSAGGADRPKYLAKTRVKLTRKGGGDTLVPADQLAKLKSDGYFLEYWQARLNPGQPAQPANGVIFAKREQTETAVTADATLSDGTWSVTLSRRLHPGAGMIDFVPGTIYQVAVAIHAGHTARRFHYVSFERSLIIGPGKADFVVAAP